MTQSLTAAGPSLEVVLAPGEQASYAVTGSFTGFVSLQRAFKRNDWHVYRAVAADTGMTGTIVNDVQPPHDTRFRFVADDTNHSTAFSGTASVAITVNTTAVVEVIARDRTGAAVLSKRQDGSLEEGAAQAGTQDQSSVVLSGTPQTTDGVGAKAGSTVSVVERGNGVVHQTVLTLTATPITLTDDPGQGQHGGVKLYDFPAGNILPLGASINAILTLTETQWTDAAEGDVGLGTAVPSVGTALTTTKQNIIATTPIAAMVAQVGPINAQSAAAGIPLAAAGATDSDLYLNVRIDDAAAHITGGGFITGTVTILWSNLGDF